MILLLTRENSSYDSATKTFWFKMDKQLDSSVKVIRIQTFSFQPTTTATYPHGVLVCSETLSNMSMRQHVNVLRDTEHRNETDILCCLHKDNHNSEHIIYTLQHPLTVTLDRRGFVNKIDIYFTDMQGNRLDGDYVPQSTAGPNLSDLTTMHNSGAGNLKFFADCDLASSYEKPDGTVTP